MNYEPWQYCGKALTSVPDGAYGFVYKIVHNDTGKAYIGRKYFFTTKRVKPLKGQSRVRRAVRESNWQEYRGSSELLNADLKELGHENFTRTIIHILPTKGSTNYAETRELFLCGVLEKVNEGKFYNICILNRYYATDYI